VIRFNAGIGTATLGVGFNGELANAIDVPTGLVQQQLIQTSAAGTPTLSGTAPINGPRPMGGQSRTMMPASPLHRVVLVCSDCP
jgi:hypothetical protein